MTKSNNDVSRETSTLPTVLEDIVQARRGHLAEIRQRIAHVDVDKLAPSQRSLYQNLAARGRGGAAFIMECKSASPSLGLIRGDYHPGEIAGIYSRYAAGISVLCEPDRFGGDYDHLATVAATTHLPVLCKDFIIDPCQIHAARYFGADAILLMMSILSDEQYQILAAEAQRFGLDVLTEVIDEAEVARAAALGAKIFGVNHRNLHDLSIDLSRSGQLARVIPGDAILIAESGIRNNQTVRQLGAHSHGFLVGSQLTSQPDVDRAARELVYGVNKVCGLTQPTSAQAAKAMGAVYGGLIFEAGSPRNVSRETSAEIIAAEPGLQYVAVSRRTTGWAELIQPGIVAVQIHCPYQGSISAERELIATVRSEIPDTIQLWRAVSMTEAEGASWAQAIADEVDLLVLDSGAGGTGETFDWSTIPTEIKHKSLLAGGISPSNTRDSLAVGTLGLDLNSGVEYATTAGKWAGIKDSGALRDCFATIRTFHYPPQAEGTLP